MKLLHDHDWIFPLHENFLNSDISRLSYNNRLLYGDWILELIDGKTFFGLHFDWPGTLESLSRPIDIPDDCDTYVFSWHIENWPHDWLEQFCQNHSNQKVIVIGEYPWKSDIPNLKVLVHHCWHWVINYVISKFDYQYKPLSERKHKISSLCNRPSLFKTYVTAYISKNYTDLKDVVLSWNAGSYDIPICESMRTMETKIGRPILDLLHDFYEKDLRHRQITTDIFDNNPRLHWQAHHPAYIDSIVNFTNETYAQTQKYNKQYPGPYLSEKSWKPLLAGTALVPVGMPGVYQYLENFGFEFDYPWDQTFDQVVGDLDRIEKVLELIDKIMSKNITELAEDLQPSVQHNWDHIRSQEFLSRVEKLNQANLEQFIKKI